MPIDVNEFLLAHGVSKNPIDTGPVEREDATVIKVGWCSNCGEEHPKGHPCYESWGENEDESDLVAEAAQLARIESGRKESEFLDVLSAEKKLRIREQGRLRAKKYREKNRERYNAYMREFMKK